jgi:uncharacterized protein (UPF0276 family)
MAKALGVGLQMNSTSIPMLDAIPSHLIQFAEILVDAFAGPMDTGYLVDPHQTALLDRLVRTYPVVAHGNYGEDFGVTPIDETVCAKRHIPIAKMMNAAWYTNHMFYGTRASSFMWSSPLQFSAAEADRAADRAKQLQDRLGMPLLHENAFYYARVPGSHLAEADFISRLVERAGTYLLLDIHNVYANARNFPDYDARKFLESYPLDRVIEIHIAGGQHIDDWYHDLHNHHVPDGGWELLRHVLSKAPNVRGVVLEVQEPTHTMQSRTVDDSWVQMTIGDLERAHAIWRETRPS